MASRNLKSAIWLVLAVSASALAANGVPGGGGGGGGGGGKPGGGGETTAGNQLSYPAAVIFTTGADPIAPATFSVKQGGGAFKVDYSYGCDVPEKIGEVTYPNTSCVSADGTTFYDATQCLIEKPACNTEVEGVMPTMARIYWQKVPTNVWSAEKVGVQDSEFADYLDWGDNLESVSWAATSTVRVETSPFADRDTADLTGYRMWHVFGQGTNEQWGARAVDDSVTPVTYDSQYAMIYTTQARVNITKLQNGSATCPLKASDPHLITQFTWDGVSHAWVGSGTQPYLLKDIPYTAELTVTGKYTYGYNWPLKSDIVPPEVNKAGWWRLTFYAPDVSFAQFSTGDAARLAPPLLPGAVAPPPATEGPLYAPVVDVANNITYIDICIKAAKGGGGSKGGKGGGE
jgi:hypothetical protein